MTIGLVFLTLLMAAIVGWLFRQTLHVQPWRAEAAGAGRPPGTPTTPPAKTALCVFLAVASSLFVLFISAYAMRLGVADWNPMPRPRLLLLNTALLAFASLAMEWSVRAARRDDVPALRHGLLAGGALTVGFIAGQLAVWRQLDAASFVVSSSAAAAFFYLLTAAHGLHVLGGLVAWARAVRRVWRGGTDPAAVRLGVELCATYWHYLLAVWIALYALLVSEGLGLAICTSAPL
ncbi:cytochrome c oxidase subunit 3 [Ramlibacter algicola]